MPLIAEYAKRFGVYDELPPYLSFALGAGETTLLRMVTAYSMFDNGGRRVKPTLIDRIQDRYGHTIYRHDERECRGCDADKWKNQPEPSLIDRREQVLDPMTAYQITSMMEGVVQRGTAAGVGFQRKSASRSPARPAPPTTKRTSGSSAFARPRGRRLSRLRQAAPSRPRRHRRRPSPRRSSKDFFKVALADKPAVPFRVPAGIKLIRVDAKTGMRAGRATRQRHPRGLQARHRAARQLFGRRLSMPPAGNDGRPDADRTILRSGTGGL